MASTTQGVGHLGLPPIVLISHCDSRRSDHCFLPETDAANMRKMAEVKVFIVVVLLEGEVSYDGCGPVCFVSLGTYNTRRCGVVGECCLVINLTDIKRVDDIKREN